MFDLPDGIAPGLRPAGAVQRLVVAALPAEHGGRELAEAAHHIRMHELAGELGGGAVQVPHWSGSPASPTARFMP